MYIQVIDKKTNNLIVKLPGNTGDGQKSLCKSNDIYSRQYVELEIQRLHAVFCKHFEAFSKVLHCSTGYLHI